VTSDRNCAGGNPPKFSLWDSDQKQRIGAVITPTIRFHRTTGLLWANAPAENARASA